MIYVYQLPPKLSNGYCFGGGRPISFLNVDWFDGHPEMTLGDLQDWVKQKTYFTSSLPNFSPSHHLTIKTRPHFSNGTMTDDAARMAYWATIDNLEVAVDIFMENSYIIGTDPYYSDLNDSLWAMLTRSRAKRESLVYVIEAIRALKKGE